MSSAKTLLRDSVRRKAAAARANGDLDRLEAIMVEDPAPDGGPYGAKGIGTPVIPAIAACVANAVRDAVE